MNEPTGIEARVCEDIAARQQVGLAKYGVSVEDSPDDMLRHAYEEALDLSVYLRAEWERRQWQPIETAPKGGGADRTDDPLWVNPPTMLLAFDGGKLAMCYWDWYYAEGGNGYRGVAAWVLKDSAELAALEYGEPTHWMPLPKPPAERSEG